MTDSKKRNFFLFFFNWREMSVIFVSRTISGLSNRNGVYTRVMVGGVCVRVQGAERTF